MEKLSFDDARTVDSLCDELERRWKEKLSRGKEQGQLPEGEAPLLAIFVERCPTHLRKAAFQELLMLEVELRQQSGIVVHRDEYARDYAEFSDTIDEVFNTEDVWNIQTLVMPAKGPKTPPATTEAATPPPAMRSFGRFQIFEELGRGAFGAVMRALDTTLDREVALKLPRFPNYDRAMVDRFLSEAQIAAQLQHPNIVAVWDRGQIDGQYFISSAFVRGETLRKYLSKQTPDARQTATWIRNLAEALAYAHEQAIIHRDIKPANIIINQQQRPMIMDFGLAKRADQATELTTDGLILGTPSHMSPEQARGVVANIGLQTDQYSLGIVFAEMLTGELPWRGSVQSVIAKLQSMPDPPQLQTPGRSIPDDLQAICQKMLQPAAENRYLTCQAVADDLTRWLDGRPVTARKISFAERSVKWCLRNRTITALIGTVVAALLIGLVSVSAALFEAERQRTDAVAQGVVADRERKNAQTQEAIAVAARSKADASANIAREESSRTLIRLAAKEIEEGRFHNANQLLEPVPQQYRNWVWRVQHARIPAEMCRIALGKIIEDVRVNPKVVFDPSGDRMAVSHPFGGASERATTRLYSVATGELLQEPGAEFPGAAPREAGFTNDGRYLGLIVTKDRKVYPNELAVYDTKTKTIVATLPNTFAFATIRNDSTKFLIQRRNGSESDYFFWSFRTNDLKKIATGPWSFPYNFGVNAAQTELSIRHRNRVTVYDIESGESVDRWVLRQLGATHTNQSHDEKLVAGQLQQTWPWNRRGRIVSPGQAAVVEFPAKMVARLENAPTVAPHLVRYAQLQCDYSPGRLSGFLISNDSRYVTLSLVGTGFADAGQTAICWWNAKSGEFIGKANRIGISPKADRYAVVEDTDIVVRKAPLHFWRFRDQQTEDELAKWEPINHYGRQVRPYVFYCKETPWVIVPHHEAAESVDLKKHVIYTGTPSMNFHFYQIATAVDHASSRVAFMVAADTVEVYSLLSGKRVARLHCKDKPANTYIAFHPDGKHLLLGNATGLEIWSIAEKTLAHKFPEVRSYNPLAGNIAVSPDRRRLALMTKQGVTLINTDQNRVEKTLPLAQGAAASLPQQQISFSHDSRWIAYGSDHGELTILSCETGRVERQFQTDTTTVHCIFHPQEPFLIVGRQDGRLVVYETDTWKVVFDEVLTGGLPIDAALTTGIPDTFRFSESANAIAVSVDIGFTRRWFEFAGGEE